MFLDSDKLQLSLVTVKEKSHDRSLVSTRKRVQFDGDLRRSLLDAALRVLVDEGAAALSLRELSRSLGVSHAAPAHYFRDKAALVTALAAEGLDQLAVAMIERMDTLGPDARLGAAGIAYVEFAETHRGHFEVMFRRDLIDITDPSYLTASDRAIGVLVEAVERRRASGWGRGEEAWVLAAMAWAAMHGIASLHAQGALGRVAGSRSPVEVAAAVNRVLDANDREVNHDVGEAGSAIER